MLRTYTSRTHRPIFIIEYIDSISLIELWIPVGTGFASSRKLVENARANWATKSRLQREPRSSLKAESATR